MTDLECQMTMRGQSFVGFQTSRTRLQGFFPLRSSLHSFGNTDLSLSPYLSDSYLSQSIDETSLNLLERMLTLNPAKRISAAEALAHPFFTTEPLPCPPSRLPRIEGEIRDEKIEEKRQAAPAQPKQQNPAAHVTAAKAFARPAAAKAADGRTPNIPPANISKQQKPACPAFSEAKCVAEEKGGIPLLPWVAQAKALLQNPQWSQLMQNLMLLQGGKLAFGPNMPFGLQEMMKKPKLRKQFLRISFSSNPNLNGGRLNDRCRAALAKGIRSDDPSVVFAAQQNCNMPRPPVDVEGAAPRKKLQAPQN
eukprot:TRINITY_DN3526_c0_g1_i8.p1 TRINITY_DN3526_c0_g1~~TRINITY_DN3526_c0_g1_i8.p1  ORF type:complete len:307 (+),score=55.81 TRINITY_DN3526_c0_g1_i8:551-1471(+)